MRQAGDMDPLPDADLGQVIADRLEELGLGAHLQQAGLPTYERDADGLAHWTDPRTGEPLSDERLAELDRMLRSQGDEPEHAVPLPLLQLARQARVRAELIDSEWHTYATLAERRGATLEATRFAVHKASADRRLLVVTDEARVLVPAFQLAADGSLRGDLEPVLAPLLAAEMDPWKVWAWLTRPAGLLGGAVPEIAVRDPEEAELVVRAAVHLGARVVIGDQGSA